MTIDSVGVAERSIKAVEVVFELEPNSIVIYPIKLVIAIKLTPRVAALAL